jgi:hypothetical protein
MYNQDHVLIAPLVNVECWNCTDGSSGDFQPGETIHVLHAYDSTHTTIKCSEKDGHPLTHPSGKPSQSKGWRFIVPNTMLARAIQADVPLETPDLIGDLIAYENGEADEETTERLFDTLRETGIGSKLQGHYSSRM